MNIGKAKTLLFSVIVILATALALFGCEKKEEFLSVSDIKGLEEVRDKGMLTFEWLSPYDATKPVLFVFHGETDENERFTINLDAEVYGEDVTYLSEDINAGTIGLKGNGLKKTADGKYYDMQSYWLDAAKFNVAVFHAEKFLCEGTENSVTKIYSSYKSRYIAGGQAVECNFGYSLAEITAAVYYAECLEKEIGKREIRFLGYGVGSNLALACAHYLYRASLTTLDNAYLPSRLTLCDPYLTDNAEDFGSVGYDENITALSGTAYIAATMMKELSVSTVAEEVIFSEEVSEGGRSRAYEDGTVSGESYEKLISASAALILAESYSTKSSFSGYKDKKRVAFDWYVYSVIGSDDNVSWKAESQKYPIGYPHTYNELSTTSKSSVNWGTGGRRPVLNDRKRTNDVRADAGATAGKNFGISAWTPTEYIRALKGFTFVQKEAKSASEETDEHGNPIYEYVDYVLPFFKSENYQYSDLGGKTLLSGTVYVDENGDGIANDGNGVRATLFVTVQDSSGKVLAERTRTTTDENGRYFIEISGYVKGTAIGFTPTGTGGVIDGFAASNGQIIVIIELYTPKGYTASGNVSSGYSWYERIEMNSFDKGTMTVTIDKTNVKSAVINNCLIVASEK